MPDMDNWLLALASSQAYAQSVITGIGDVKINATHDGLVFTNKQDGSTFEVILPGFHTHSNLSTILEKFTKDANGNILYNGNTIITKDNLKAGSNIKIVEGADGKFTISSTGGGGSLERAIKSSVNVGAISIGQNFPIGTDNTTMWEKLLQKDLAPLVTITSTEDDKIVYEKGIDLTTTLTVNAKKINSGDNDITKVVLQATPTNVDYDYTDNSPNASTNTYTKTVTINSTTSFKGTATNAKNLVGNKTMTFTFVNPIYIGSVPETLDESTIVETDIKDNSSKILVNIIPSANKYTETMTVDMKKIIIAYDKTLGELKEINDVANKINTITAFTKFEIDMTMEDGTVLPYYCYIGKVRSKITDKDMQFVW